MSGNGFLKKPPIQEIIHLYTLNENSY
jgi:hypothetical protein